MNSPLTPISESSFYGQENVGKQFGRPWNIHGDGMLASTLRCHQAWLGNSQTKWASIIWENHGTKWGNCQLENNQLQTQPLMISTEESGRRYGISPVGEPTAGKTRMLEMVSQRRVWLSRRVEIKKIWSNWALLKSGHVQLWHFSTNHTSANVTSCNMTKMTPLPPCPVLFWSHRFYLQTYLDGESEDCHAKSQNISKYKILTICTYVLSTWSWTSNFSAF